MLFKSLGFHGKNCADCGLLGCNTVWQVHTKVSEKHAASSFKVNVNKEKNAVQLYRQAARNLVNQAVANRKIKKFTYKCH